MATLEDVAWELRTALTGKLRLEPETGDGLWLERAVSADNQTQTLLLLECGGMGIADRLRRGQKRAKELGVPLRVINGIAGANSWVDGLNPKQRVSPVKMMTLVEMDCWLEKNYPRRKFFSVLYG